MTLRPLPPQILRVIELGRRGYTLREIAEELGVSYSYLRKRLCQLRRQGYDIPRFRAGRRGNNRRIVQDLCGFTQELLPSRGNKKHRVFSSREIVTRPEQLRSSSLNNTVRLSRDALMKHVVSVVLSEGAIHLGELYRRLRTWYSFSRSTLYRAVRKLEFWGFVEVERRRGPRGNLLRPSRMLVMASLGARVPKRGNDYASGMESVLAYVENRGRREHGFEFSGVSLGHVRWLQVYGVRAGSGGKWFRVEFHPFKGEFPDWVGAVRDLVRVAVAVSVVVGISYRDLVLALAEEYASFMPPSPRPAVGSGGR